MGLAALALPGAAGVSAFAGTFVLLGSRRGGLGPLPRAPLAWDLGAVLHRVPVLASLLARDDLRGRRTEALREMPTLLDIVNLGLTAGLSFDASLELYCQRYHTRLATSFEEALLAWRIGAVGRDEALRALADELDVAALRRFASAVGEALSFGTPLASVLEQQAQAIRDEQRAQVEEEIEKVPVRMLIPLGTLILPAMLLAILGPLLGPALGV